MLHGNSLPHIEQIETSGEVFPVKMTVQSCLKEILIILPTNSESKEEDATFIIGELFYFNAKFS
jgi:hypothetical protein